MNRLLHISIFILLIASQTFAQTWKQYNIATGVTTDVVINLVSSGNSANTSSNAGILSKNFSGDTSRKFFPLDIVNDPSAYPWRMTVNINGTTGILIDPYHVLTAGHVISFTPDFGNIKIIPAYSYAGNPYQYAYPVKVYLRSDFSVCTGTDIGIIQLDRPLGSLVGWAGVGYTKDTSFYRSRYFYNPSYPSAAPFNGQYMYNWKGIFDANYPDYIYSFRNGYSGMSGSSAMTIVNGNYVSYGILISSGVKFNLLTAAKYDAINSVLNNDIPTSVNLVPVYTGFYPEKIKQGNAPDSLSIIIVNYSKQNASQYSYNVKYYISSDSIISSTDELIGSYDYTDNINAKASIIKTQKLNLNSINKPSGKYWVGVILSNGTETKTLDAVKIEVINTNYFTVKGRVISSQNGSGINGVVLSGFPESVISDYNGNYSCMVPAGFSGTIYAALTGNDLSPASFTISNLNANVVQNFTISKKTITITGKFSFPVSGKGVWGIVAKGLVNEPKSDGNGNLTATVYYGWSGNVNFYKEGYFISPASYTSYSNVSSNSSVSLTAGFEIKGYIYDGNGLPIQNVYLSGLYPGNIYSDSIGYYRTFLDSGWSGTVIPKYGVYGFNPDKRVYSNINFFYTYQDFQVSSPNKYAVKLKVFLSGDSPKDSDTMATALNYKHLLPLAPPDTFSGNVTPFIYKKKPVDYITNNFLLNHPEIVDWVVIELKDSKFRSVDTVAALLTKTGKVISTVGDSLIPVNETSGNYYVIIRHRNHIAIMSASMITPSMTPTLFDFSRSLANIYGGAAKLIKSGLYGMYASDANYDGAIDTLDFNLYEIDNKNAEDGYKITDFNLSGFINSADFMLYAPNKQSKIKTNIK